MENVIGKMEGKASLLHSGNVAAASYTEIRNVPHKLGDVAKELSRRCAEGAA